MEVSNHSNVLPGVFLSILGLLAADKNLTSWKLSRPHAGKFSLWISHSPAKSGSAEQHLILPGSKTRKQDTVTACVTKSPIAPKPKRKRKSPAQRKRDRERFIKWQKLKWHQKRHEKTGTGSQPVPETSTSDIQAANQQALDRAATGGATNQTVTVVQPQDTLVQVDHPLQPQETISPQYIPGQLDDPLQMDLPGSDFECNKNQKPVLN